MSQQKTLNRATITDNQCVALRKFAVQHGRNWKSKLVNAWDTGDYLNVTSENKALLQQLRNQHGRNWLNGVTTEKLRLLTDIILDKTVFC